VINAQRPQRARRTRPAAGATRRIAFLVLAFAVVGSLVLAVVSAQALVSQGSFRMETLSKRAALLRQDYGRLRLEVAELSSPARIVREAERLGMRLPDSGAVQIIPVTAP
jgi:cell division protein FtsL